MTFPDTVDSVMKVVMVMILPVIGFLAVNQYLQAERLASLEALETNTLHFIEKRLDNIEDKLDRLYERREL